MIMFFDIGVVLALFLAVLVFSKKDKILADNILGIWFVIIGINILVHYRLFSDTEYTKFFLVVDFLAFLLHGPFLYLYVDTLTNQRQRLYLRDGVVFLPAFVFVVHVITRSFTNNSNKLMMLNESLLVQKCWKCGTIQMMAVVSIPFFVWLAYRAIVRYDRKVFREYSFLEEVEMNWLKRFTLGVILAWGLFIALVFTDYYQVISLERGAVEYSLYTISFVLLYLGIYGIKNTSVFSTRTGMIVDTTNNSPEREIDADKILEIESKITSYMKDHKPYLKARLTLKELALLLDVDLNSLSFFLSQRKNQTFYDFINTYRVEEFIAQIKANDNNNYTHIGIAFDCGFNSKSSFYSIFKKHTGCTPQEYIIQNKL